LAEENNVDWKVRSIRGATTVTANTKEAIADAVQELLDDIDHRNELDPAEIISVVFTATPDLDAIFPAAIARQRPNWDSVPLLDVQQMAVAGSLAQCIRVLIHINTPKPQADIHHSYLRHARNLRPDWTLTEIAQR
jgi:chorismate mutase